MAGRWHKLDDEVVRRLGFTPKLLAYLFAMYHPCSTVTDIEAGANVSRRSAFAGKRERNGLRNESGTETERAEAHPEPILEVSRNGNGMETERLAERSSRARDVFGFGSLTATTETTTIDPPTPQGGFDVFWKSYPRKVGKPVAFKAWNKQKPDLALVLTALAWQRTSEQWARDNGQFIPHPSTYLNQRRWEDEPPSAQIQAPEQDFSKFLGPRK